MTITNTEAAAAIANIVPRQVQRFLKENIVFPHLVGRDYDDTDIQQHGDRVTISVLGSVSVNLKAQGSDVTLQTPSLTGQAITMIQPEVSFPLDHLTKIQARPDLMRGYGEKSGIALAEYVNAYIGSVIYPAAGNTIDATTGLGADDFYEAERLLNDNSAPQANRFFVLGQDAKKEASGIDQFVKYEYQGPPGWEALRTGQLGQLASFRTYMSQGITETGGQVKNVAFSKGAVQMISRPLDTQMNGMGGQVSNFYDEETGLNIRTSVWYDFKKQAWYMTTDTLFGIKVLEANSVVAINTTDI